MPGPKKPPRVEAWNEEDLKKSWWFLVTAFVVDAVYLLPAETEEKLFRGWRHYVQKKIKVERPTIRADFAKHLHREAALVAILDKLGCPEPKKRLKEVGLAL